MAVARMELLLAPSYWGLSHTLQYGSVEYEGTLSHSQDCMAGSSSKQNVATFRTSETPHKTLPCKCSAEPPPIDGLG